MGSVPLNDRELAYVTRAKPLKKKSKKNVQNNSSPKKTVRVGDGATKLCKRAIGSALLDLKKNGALPAAYTDAHLKP